MGKWVADHFSAQSAAYAAFRPTYPDALGEWLATVAPSPIRVWDCATGSGQAAVMLARHFQEVIATDASVAQLANAARHERITYRVASADHSGLADASCDVVTVAQAAHWFSLSDFYAEAARVLRPGGLLAVWGYARLTSDSPEVDALVHHFQYTQLNGYWPAGREYVDDEYRSLPFQWPAVVTPRFEMTARWTRDQLLGYISSWSAVERYRRTTGTDPLPSLEAQIKDVWRDTPDVRTIRWPLFVRAGLRTWHLALST
jgi:SAM-dependent methyltransferase